jgi:hypothetical protein
MPVAAGIYYQYLTSWRTCPSCCCMVGECMSGAEVRRIKGLRYIPGWAMAPDQSGGLQDISNHARAVVEMPSPSCSGVCRAQYGRRHSAYLAWIFLSMLPD